MLLGDLKGTKKKKSRYMEPLKKQMLCQPLNFLQKHFLGNEILMFKNKTLYFLKWFNKDLKYVGRYF